MLTQLSSTGLLKENLNIELNSLSPDNPNYQKFLSDILGYDTNIPIIIEALYKDRNIKLFDFITKKETYKLDIGPVPSQLHYDLFDAIRVDNDIPFIVLNLNKKYAGTIKKGLYLSDDRRIKLYHSTDTELKHQEFIGEWSKNKLNIPETMIIKVLVKEPGQNFVTINSYVNVIFRFDDGLYIESAGDFGLEKAKQVVDILRRNTTGFQIKLDETPSISGSFAVDRIIIEPVLFRAFLSQSILITDKNPIKFYPFLWTHEKGKALSLRKDFFLNFELGDIKAKILISLKEVKPSNVFYAEGQPIKFKSDSKFDSVSISGVSSLEKAELVRNIIMSAFYMYGREKQTQRGIEINSYLWADIYNKFCSPQKPIYGGSTFRNSVILTSEDLESIPKIIMRLRALDPTFFGSIATAKSTSDTLKQPIGFLSTSNPNWKDKLWNMLMDTYNDKHGAQRQIIRYPFDIVGSDGEQVLRSPITRVSPYFFICTEKNPFFNIKPNRNPFGGVGTYHPYLISCTTRQSIVTPGSDIKEKFWYLSNLEEDYTVKLIDKQRAGRSNHELKTPKILNPGATASLPIQLVGVFSKIFNVEDELSKLGDTTVKYNDVSFIRTGTILSSDSLLHVLASSTKMLQDVKQSFTILPPDQKIKYIKTVLKPRIANTVNWNLARQEFFDMNTEQIKEYFLKDDTPIDSRLFKTILEQFFNAYIVIVQFDNFKARIEVPRHKFFYVPPTYQNPQVYVIFKHFGSESLRSTYPQYEEVLMYGKDSKMDMVRLIDWEFEALNSICNTINSSTDINFVTVNRTNEKK